MIEDAKVAKAEKDKAELVLVDLKSKLPVEVKAVPVRAPVVEREKSSTEDEGPLDSDGEPIQSNRCYHIQSYISDLNLDVYGSNKTVGGRICQAVQCSTQVWKLEAATK